MSTLKVLKEYLVGEGGYLLNDDNNGKTVMLSGAWGSGKTHFWQYEIAREQKKIEVNGETHHKYTKKEYEDGLSYKLKEKKKSCVYISLYGKDSLSELKKEVLFRASTESDYLSDDIEAFGFNALATIDEVGGAISAIYKVASNMNESRRDKKGTNKLKDGGIICFDDFERKSKNIDLNDLFGFISQLAIGLNCKVVIILNSDVFEGEEKNVFKTVKEKTVNKYFYFEPTVEKLFNSIYNSEDKYKRLDEYKTEILNAITLSEELNARIYIQVLDNCLEWIYKGYNSSGLLALIFTTIQFVLIHKVLDYSEEVELSHLEYMGGMQSYEYTLLNEYHYVIQKMSILGVDKVDFREINFNDIKYNIYNELSRFSDKKNSDVYTDEIKQIVLNQLRDNEKELSTIWKYGYRLYYMDKIDKETYGDIVNFVKTGILLKKDEEIQ